MRHGGTRRHIPKEQLRQGVALCVLLMLAALAIAGPTGLLTWSENKEVLAQHNAEIARLTEQRDALKNKVDRLNPEGADPDLVGELLRRNLNVVHNDEVVLTVDEE